MHQINSLDRAFTVLTYFLSTKNFNQINNQKTYNEMDESSTNLNNIILQANKNQDKLGAINKALSLIENNVRNSGRMEQTPTKPYSCNETNLRLFCEDNKYSKHLLLIGRGRKPLDPAQYQKLLDGISCDVTCINSDKDFFIGWNNFGKIYRRNLYGVLIVYIDNYGSENFIYIPELEFDDKKLTISQSRSSMLNYTLQKLMDNTIASTTTKTSIQNMPIKYVQDNTARQFFVSTTRVNSKYTPAKIMSLEHMVAAMSCMISACGDNFTPAILKNSVISQPLDDLWDVICKKQALNFDKKLTQLLQNQQKTTDTLNSIEKSIDNLRALSAQWVDAKRSKREVSHNFDVLPQSRFNCNGSITGIEITQIKADLPTFLVECEDKNYGDNWLLIASLDAAHCKQLNSKCEDDLTYGFGGLVNIDNNVNGYFIGRQRLHRILKGNEVQQFLIFTHDENERVKKIIINHPTMHYNESIFDNEITDYRLQSLNGYECDIIDLLQDWLREILSLPNMVKGETERLTIFLKSEN